MPTPGPWSSSKPKWAGAPASCAGSAGTACAFDEVIDETGTAHTRRRCWSTTCPRSASRGYHLPVDVETAAGTIRAQQAPARDRYPGTPASQLALFPAVKRNPRGTKPFNPVTLCDRFRTWVDSLPRLVGPDGEPYDRSAVISPYSFRHCFAQRLADQGIPIEVLADAHGAPEAVHHPGLLPGHPTAEAPSDRHARRATARPSRAERARPTVERLLESEHLRESGGPGGGAVRDLHRADQRESPRPSMPVPSSVLSAAPTTAPTPSSCPSCSAHLGRLLADNERLRAAAPELEEWARNAAIPSARRDRRASRRSSTAARSCSPTSPSAERAGIEDAIAVLRRGRAQLDTTVPVRFLGVIGPSPTKLFPNIVRDQDQTTTDEI